MKILHYSLGFPPYRTGGLTKFCMDLMKQQVKEGHEVSLLWPGEMRFINKRTKIRNNKLIEGIKSYEVINPTPISFDEGIKDFDLFMCSGDRETYEQFLDNLKPEVIHVHTLMGLHKSLLDVAKNRDVRLVFTAHDFFPICPKVTIFRHGEVCKCVDSCEECGVCNNTALSIREIHILQSPFYRYLKDSEIVKRLRKQHRDNYLSETTENIDTVGTPKDYKRLRNYNYSMLKLFDIVHYNSSVTKKVYEKHFGLDNCVQISITHSRIKDHKKIRIYDKPCLKIRYLGPKANGKGYDILKNAVEKMWKEGRKVSLDVHFELENKPDYIQCHGRFDANDLGEIFDDTDVLICPSVWYETFGYTVLEALSYGVPVVISDNVGAKDIMVDNAGFVINNITTEKLYIALSTLDSQKLRYMNESSYSKQPIKTIDEMEKEFESILYKC